MDLDHCFLYEPGIFFDNHGPVFVRPLPKKGAPKDFGRPPGAGIRGGGSSPKKKPKKCGSKNLQRTAQSCGYSSSNSAAGTGPKRAGHLSCNHVPRYVAPANAIKRNKRSRFCSEPVHKKQMKGSMSCVFVLFFSCSGLLGELVLEEVQTSRSSDPNFVGLEGRSHHGN